MPDWAWLVLAVVAVLVVCWYVLWREFHKAPTRDDWPHDDSLGG